MIASVSTPESWIEIDRVGRLLADADLADAAGPGAAASQRPPGASRPGIGDRIVPWFRAASRDGGQVLERLDLGHQGRQQQRLDQPVVVVEPLEPARRSRGRPPRVPVVPPGLTSCCCSSSGRSLLVVEPLGVLEVDPHHVGERLVAVGHHVPQVAQRDQVAHLQRVALVDQQLQHDLQGRPLALEHAGDGHQGLHQRRAERVDHAEHLPVGFAGQQRLHDLVPDLDRLLEGVLQLRPARIVLRPAGPASRR